MGNGLLLSQVGVGWIRALQKFRHFTYRLSLVTPADIVRYGFSEGIDRKACAVHVVFRQTSQFGSHIFGFQFQGGFDGSAVGKGAHCAATCNGIDTALWLIRNCVDRVVLNFEIDRQGVSATSDSPGLSVCGV